MDGPDGEFLGRVANILARLESEAAKRNYPLLASLVGIARAEAEDDLRTSAEVKQTFASFQNGDSRKPVWAVSG